MNCVENELYGRKIQNMDKNEYARERVLLMEIIKDEALPHIHMWPRKYIIIFWKRPFGDGETFQMMIFLSGNI